MNNLQTAINDIADKPFIKGMKYREQQGRATRLGLWYDKKKHRYPVEVFERAFVRNMRRRGIPIFAHSFVRSDVDQLAVYEAGRSNALPGESPHNHGCAVDIIHGVHAWKISDEAWQIFGHVGKEVAKNLSIPIVWGGDWTKPYDPAHWQLKNWRKLEGVTPPSQVSS